MSPELIEIIRLTIRMAVVLPPPEGPTRTQISPAGTVSESDLTAGSARRGERLVTASKTIPDPRPAVAVTAAGALLRGSVTMGGRPLPTGSSYPPPGAA